MPRIATKKTVKKEADPVAELCAGVLPTKDFTNTPDSFWRLCREYPHREAAMVYLWRLKPKIDRTLTGNKHSNIAKWPLDHDDAATDRRLLDEHGSGYYQLRLNDSNRPQGRITVAMARIEIDRPDRPAVIPPGELVKCEENASYINWCRANNQTTQLWWEKEETMPQTAEGVAVQELSDITRDLLDRDKHRPPAKDPFELALQAQTVFGSQKGDSVGDLVKIMKLMNETRAESGDTNKLLMSALIEMMKDRKSEASGLSQAKEIFELVTAARETGGGAGDGGGWSSFFANLPAAISGLAGLMGQVVAMKGMSTAGAAPAAGSYPVTESTNQLTNQPSAIVPENGDEQVQLAQLFQLGQKAVRAFNEGVAGDEFAGAVCTMEPDLYNLLAGMNKAQILAVLQSQPAVWAQLSPRLTEVETFLDQFLAYGQEPDTPPAPGVVS